MPSTIEVLARELTRALLPLDGVFGNRQRTRQLLELLGWEPPPGVPVPFGPVRLDALVGAFEAVQEAIAAADAHVGDDGVQLTLDLKYAELVTALMGAVDDLAALPGRVGAWPADYLVKTNLPAELVPRLLAYTLVQSWRVHHPTLLSLLSLTGVLQATHWDPDPVVFRTEHIRFALRFDRVVRLLTDPRGLFAEVFGWGTAGAAIGDLVVALSLVFGSLGRPAIVGVLDADTEAVLLGRPVPEAAADPLPSISVDLLTALSGSAPQARMLLAALRHTAPGSTDGGLAVGTVVSGTPDLSFPLTGGWRLELRTPPDPTGVALLARAGKGANLVTGLTQPAPAAGSGDLVFILHYTPKDGRPIPIVALPGGSGLTAAELTLAFGVRAGSGLFAEIGTVDGQWKLDVGGLGGPVEAILPRLMDADLDVGISWSGGRFSLRGSAGLSVTFPVNLGSGPVELRTVTVALAPGGVAVPVDVTSNIAVEIGPVLLVVDGVGLQAAFGFRPVGDGNLGPVQVDLGFRPPTGLGVALEAGPVSGGGYLAVDGLRYAGVLQVKLNFLAVTAFGIVDEPPGGGVSFVAVLGIRFWPGIQLGFGFAITGVGGLVGMNRTANVDLLRERLATGAAGNVLFCDDPVKNAPTLLGDLDAFFPKQQGSFVVGPTLQIGWVAPIVRLDVAVLIELPGPKKIIILGSVKVLIGIDETRALLYLRMDFLGALDFEQRLVSLDAYLVNSHAMGVFRLTGGMAFRLSYGDNPYVLLSIGGFHPRFDPGPLNLPSIPRVGAVLDTGIVPGAYFRLEMYVAFTSNTLQLGAKVEAGLKLGPINAHGYLSFDALIQFRPFAFDIAFAAGFSVEVFDVTLCSVDVSGRLTGPGPLVVHAAASVRLLFVKVRGSATISLGGDDADRPQPIPSIVEALKPELSDVNNLRAAGEDTSIVLKPGIAVDGVLLSPRGALIWEQKRAPLETLVDRFEGAPLIGQHQLVLSGAADWTVTDESDWFSPGTFTSLDLESSQTLNNATFQVLRSGIRIAGGPDATAPTPVPFTPRIKLVKRPDPIWFLAIVGSYLTPALAAMLAERDTTPPILPGPSKVTVVAETHDLYSVSGIAVAEMETPFQAFQLSRLGDGMVATPSFDVVVTL